MFWWLWVKIIKSNESMAAFGPSSSPLTLRLILISLAFSLTAIDTFSLSAYQPNQPRIVHPLDGRNTQ